MERREKAKAAIVQSTPSPVVVPAVVPEPVAPVVEPEPVAAERPKKPIVTIFSKKHWVKAPTPPPEDDSPKPWMLDPKIEPTVVIDRRREALEEVTATKKKKEKKVSRFKLWAR